MDKMGISIKDIRDATKFVGAIIRLRRQIKGWYQSDLAEFATLNRNYIGEIERGESIPSLITLIKIAKALGLSSVGSLFNEFDEEMYPSIKLFDENKE